METDILVIGGGIAGLTVAWKAAQSGKAVILSTKAALEDSNTSYAQGGIAAAIGKDDAPELHLQDTLRAGDGLVNTASAGKLVTSIPSGILELASIGVPFEKNSGGFTLSREAVHCRARIVHVADSTGKSIVHFLSKETRKKVEIREHLMAIRLLLHQKKCIGCLFLDTKRGEIFPIYAKAVVLATGGVGQAFAHSTNPDVATGDGIALAYDAGASIEDMEFVQFHPTMLYGVKPSFLISETLRGEGGLLKNTFGTTYMKGYHRDGELAPRDVVSKFSFLEMKRTKAKHVWLDVRHLGAEYLKKRFPMIASRCLEAGIDITKQLIPVAPAAHYLCGGIKVDAAGRTGVSGLYAVGECACTELHGADRLASNSLAEGFVFGSALAKTLFADIERKNRTSKLIERHVDSASHFSKDGDSRARTFRKRIQNAMWKDVGILRTVKGLTRAKNAIASLLKESEALLTKGISREKLEARNLARVGGLIIDASLARKESRGTHVLLDFPERDDAHWKKHLSLRRTL